MCDMCVGGDDNYSDEYIARVERERTEWKARAERAQADLTYERTVARQWWLEYTVPFEDLMAAVAARFKRAEQAKVSAEKKRDALLQAPEVERNLELNRRESNRLMKEVEDLKKQLTEAKNRADNAAIREGEKWRARVEVAEAKASAAEQQILRLRNEVRRILP